MVLWGATLSLRKHEERVLSCSSLRLDPVDGSRWDTFVSISIRVADFLTLASAHLSIVCKRRRDLELNTFFSESCHVVIEPRGRAKNGKTTCFDFDTTTPLFVEVPHTNMNGYVEHLILKVVGRRWDFIYELNTNCRNAISGSIVVVVAVALKWDWKGFRSA